MFLTDTQLIRHNGSWKAQVWSLDGSLYRVSLSDGEREGVLSDDGVSAACFRNLLDVKKRLAGLPVWHTSLVQRSAYDEMVGQPLRDTNELTLPLQLNSDVN